jgi:hypothetical protein|tara:strand:- start:71 stop:238 length:168 start_codon:yes stop_codon:yes gene_type:complete
MGRGAAGFMTRSDLGGAVAPAPGQVRVPLPSISPIIAAREKTNPKTSPRDPEPFP